MNAHGKIVAPTTRAGLRGPCTETPVSAPFTAPEGATAEELEQLGRAALWASQPARLRNLVWFVRVTG